MGVAGAGPFVRALKPPDASKIQERFETIEDAFKHVRVVREDAQRYTLYIDFWATVRGRFHTLCGQHHRPASLSHLPKHYNPLYTFSQDQLPSFIVSRLFEDIEKQVEAARRALDKENVEVVVVVDNQRTVVQAKYLTKKDRMQSNLLAAGRYKTAVTRIEELLKLRAEKQKKTEDKPAADDSYRTSRFTAYPKFKRRYGKRTMESAIWANVKEIRKTAWTQVHLNISKDSLSALLNKSKYTVFEETAIEFALKKEEDSQVKNGPSVWEPDEDGTSRLPSDDELGIPQEEAIIAANNLWKTVNQHLLLSSSMVKVVISSNEADITLFNLLSATNGSGVSLLIANDSDYHFFPDEGDLHFTIACSYRGDKDTRYLSSRPWVVTNVDNLHANLNRKWPTRIERTLAALLAGHDYTGAGLRRAGLDTLNRYKVVKASFSKTIETVLSLHKKKVKNNRSSYWCRAFEQLTTVNITSFPQRALFINQLLHALRVLLMRQHRHLEEDIQAELDQVFDSVLKGKTAPSQQHVNPFSILAKERRNIELLFIPSQSRSERRAACEPAEQNIKRQRNFSSNLARSPDNTLPQKRHNAWLYDPTSPEKLRPSKKDIGRPLTLPQSTRPDSKSELYVPEEDKSKHGSSKFFGPDDSADPDLDENGDPIVPGDHHDGGNDDNDSDNDDNNDDDEQDDECESDEGEGLVAGPSGKRKRKAASSGSKKRAKAADNDQEDKKPKKNVALQLNTVFPTKTHVRWLPSALKNMSGQDFRQRDKPLLPLIQLCTCAERLSIQETILPVCNEYFQRLFSLPEFRYLYDFRTFGATKGDNESVLFRNIIRLFAAEPATKSRGAPVPFSFLTYRHSHNSFDDNAALITAIKDRWLRVFVPDKMASSPAELQELRTSASLAIISKLETYDKRVVAFFHDHLKYDYDCVLMDLVNEYYVVGSVFAAVVRVPVAPFTNSQSSLGYHGSRIYRAVKSKLRSRPLQEGLSFYILEQCKRALPDASLQAQTIAHAGIWKCFVETSVNAFNNHEFSEEASIGFTHSLKVATEEVAMVILNKLYALLEPCLHMEAKDRTLRDFFEGKDKLQFGLKHIRLFLAKLGYDFKIHYDPTFCFWGSERLVSVIGGRGEGQAASLTDWLNIHFLFHTKATITACDIDSTSERSMGLLDELWCFHHVREGKKERSLLRSRGTPELRLSADWKTRYIAFQQDVKTQLSLGGARAARTNRSVIFDVIFKRCIPQDEIWAGSFHTDGYRLQMLAHDPSICVVPSSLNSRLEEADFKMEDASALDFLTFFIEEADQSFCSWESFQKDTIGRTHRLRKGQTVFEADIYQNPGSGFYARKRLAGRKLQTVPALPNDLTKGGVYKRVIRLDETTKVEIQDTLIAMSKENAGARIRIAGDDPGIRFSQAIHINDPPTSAGYLSHFKDGRLKDINSNRGSSSTFLVAPHALADIARQATRTKQRLREIMPISTFDVLGAIKRRRALEFDAPQRMTNLYNVLDTSLKTSRDYCHAGFRRTQQVRRFHDKVATQFAEMTWPGYTNKTIPRSPLLFAIGDSCGKSNSKAKKHHADYSMTGLRHLQKRLESWGLPVKFVLVDEAFSSQVCPDPKCKAEDGLRSVLAKLPYKGSTAECLRVHQCTQCTKTYHRDTAAAMNIGFVAWHVLIHGRHPWRKDD